MAKTKSKKSSGKKSSTTKKSSGKGSGGARAKKTTKKSGGMKMAQRAVAAVKKAVNGGNDADVLNMILQHHEPLKDLFDTMKDSSVSLAKRKAAFEKFGPLLASHAKAEEEVLYVYMKKNKDLREDGFEGDVEHILADQLLEEIQRTSDPDLWSARVKVLAELVEHHIQEEENDMFPEIREETEESERAELGQVYLQRYEELLAKGGVDAAAEKPKGDKMLPSLTHS